MVDGQIVVEAEDTDIIQIVLNGVNITCLNNAPIYIKSADKVFITLKEGIENNLKDNSEYVQVDDNTVDGVIFSKADLTLNGSGTIIIDAGGDGIDSNGSLYISGGTIYVSGSANSADGGLDYNGSGEITGGTVVVAGSSGMIQGFSDTSTQYSLLYNLSTASEAETEVILTDVDGKVVVSYIPNKQYQSVVISSPNLVKDATYTLTCGNQVSEIILSEIVTSNGLQGINVPDGQGMRGPRGEGNIEKQSGQRDMVKPENKNPTGTQNDK